MTSPISRRRALSTVGVAGVGTLGAALVGCGTNAPVGSQAGASGSGTSGSARSDLAARFQQAQTCSVTPEQTEGPYYLDVDMVRSDIREDTEGEALRVGVQVLDESCEPLPNALVEIWHCDAFGAYSGYTRQWWEWWWWGQPDETTFLRGGQVTDPEGIVEFTTVYPGWYPGRTPHIHTKVHLDNSEVLTSQLYFDDDFTATVYAENEPYNGRTGQFTFNSNDGIFSPETVMTVTEEDDGYLGLITMTIQR